MANPHNRKPIYFRSTNPGLANVDEIASRIFQFDETGNKPAEVLTGAAVMPPQQALNEILVWSDSNTLGYGDIPNAPMFWGNGGLTGAAGDEKILQMINHVAGRKSGLQFYDLSLATNWILDQSDIYTNLGATASGTGAYGTADVIVELRSATDKISLNAMYTNQGKPEAVLYGTHGDSALNNPIPEMPMVDGDVFTINGVDIIEVGGQVRVDFQLNFKYSHNGYVNAGKYITYYVNGTVMNQQAFYTSTSISFYVYPVGGVQNGDEIKLVISDVPGHAPYTVSGGSSSSSGSSTPTYPVGTGNYTLKFTNSTSEIINKIDVGNIDGSNATFVATGVTPIPANGGQVAWLPLGPGESVELTGVDGFLGGGGSGTGTTAQIGLGVYFNTGATRFGYVTVNGVAGNPYGFGAGTTTNYFNAARSGYQSLQAGDAVEVLFTNIAI